MNVCSIDDNIRIPSNKYNLPKLGCILRRRSNSRFLIKMGVIICAVIIMSTLLLAWGSICPEGGECSDRTLQSTLLKIRPHQPHIYKGADNSKVYQLVLVADLDDRSRVEVGKEVWQSFLLEGTLSWDGADEFKTEFSRDPVSVQSDYSRGGRGMELSELIAYNGDLLSVDDRTGIVYKLVTDASSGKWNVIPWLLLSDGDGNEKKGLKAEWMAIKDKKLYVGGLGKEWTSVTGDYLNDNPMYIKVVSPEGSVQHVFWKKVYLKLREHLNISTPGYLIHEAIMWSEHAQRWVVLPRRVSHEKYNDVDDEKRGSNIMMLCTEDFEQCDVITVGSVAPSRGYSSFKFLPGTDERIIVALRSEEDNGKIATYLTVFDLLGQVLLSDVMVGNEKYEGVEFV